jgi:hypothetical protein
MRKTLEAEGRVHPGAKRPRSVSSRYPLSDDDDDDEEEEEEDYLYRF